MDRWHYLIVLGACVLVTLPLEIFGKGVYRQPRRLVTALLPVLVVFLIWDTLAVAGGVWWYNPIYITGIVAPGDLPIEEILFFVVIPLCGLLTYNAVDAILNLVRGRARRAEKVDR
ncbi:lycopene cyclase domain protein [Mycolicibacterium chubuense NBB4]|uniref:Lycopene cyclase domain protein n=1 Tax=Mycolicibacterium chubuense (strain NBB4) TaxID=710421 RepID=I4BFD3_MYCCN|nr:lycopene cyclase domain-containing protein [Mycolicibacterium chubuense]AFM15990.1 lycopene cyclase domain protein [Mycolicibacterium chubuense NBB4]